MPRELDGRQALAFQTAERLRVPGTGRSSERQAAWPGPPLPSSSLVARRCHTQHGCGLPGGSIPSSNVDPQVPVEPVPGGDRGAGRRPALPFRAATGDRCPSLLSSSPVLRPFHTLALRFGGGVCTWCLGLGQNAGPSNTENRPVSLAHRDWISAVCWGFVLRNSINTGESF